MDRIRGAVTAATIVQLVAVGAHPGVAQDATKPQKTRPPVGAPFTQGQADRGQALFDRFCGFCHAPRDISNRHFQTGWTGQSLERFYTFVRTMMPFDNPGRLTNQQYTDIVAYVLKLNRYPVGTEELRPDPRVLGSFRFEFETASEP